MGDAIWDGDTLDRRADAEFLLAYLTLQNKRSVEGGEKGVSIAISAPWGAGKTYFLERFARMLRAGGHRVAEVNAWRDDHAEDPLFAVMAAVLTALGKSSGGAGLRKALTNNVGKIAIRAGKGVAKRLVTVMVGAEAVDGIVDDLARGLADAGEETLAELAEQALKHFEDGKRAIEDFRKTLSDEVNNSPPLFVLIDELDRCRPSYAVTLLERVKHLFDVPNVIFVFATHSGQLTHTIRAIYGAEFDAERYLHRFFDRTYQFEKPSLRQFIDTRWISLNFDANDFIPLRYNIRSQDVIEDISHELGLTLRDINQCLDIVASVRAFFEPRVRLPVVWLYILSVAHHLNRDAEIDYAVSLQDISRDVKLEFFTDRPIISVALYDQLSRTQKTKTASIRDFLNAFRDVINKGIWSYDGSEGLASEYAASYAQEELNKLYDGRGTGAKIPTILRSVGGMIRRAGRISVETATEV